MEKPSHKLAVRVRYSETDAMGYLHHSNHAVYFEIGRTELFRAQGGNYRRMEELGLFFVVVQLNIKFRLPARYDDELTLFTTLDQTGAVKLVHSYRLMRDEDLIAEANSTLACVDVNGQVQMIPDDLHAQTGE
ncbi:MAG: thioesterase family protein [Planctomycetaceae bacterium]|jgi:acyl-CoA thioester hydrolase|nr:acyl-CoA thioesterase [Planctomycetaceae bacterium]MDG2390774.1 thioesterase family protein [Planctomycetaceae bacterium]